MRSSQGTRLSPPVEAPSKGIDDALRVQRRSFGWGFLDQTLASVTTFGLTLAAARQFGPAGVGAVAIPYAACLVALGLQRALLVDPYMTRRASADVPDTRALGSTMLLSLGGGILGTVIFVGVGLSLDGATGAGFLAFAIWLIPALMHGVLRPAAFRGGRGDRATLGSALMLATFAVTAGLWLHGSVTALIAGWGIGTLAAVGWLLAAGQGSRLTSPITAARWWSVEAMHFGGWLAAGAIAWSLFSYGLLAGLAAVTGTAAIGGYRAIESIFSPLSLLAPALANPGFKAMRDAWGAQPSEALRLAYRLSAVATVCMGAYALAVASGKNIVFDLYGDEFRKYSSLIAPIAIGQTLVAGTIGFVTLLKVARRGRDAVIVGAGGALIALVVALPLGALIGITAAAWGIALSFVAPLFWAVRRARGETRGGRVSPTETYRVPPPPAHV